MSHQTPPKNYSDKKFWDIKAAADKAGEVYIYGGIYSYKLDDEDVTAKSFKEDLDALGDIDTLNLYVNSPGGSVFQAQTIHNIIKRHKATQKTAYVDGLAASAASFLIMAANKIIMPKNTAMMVHYPMTCICGNSLDLRKGAETLDKIAVGMIECYLAHAGDKLTEDKLKELLEAETWLTAQECIDYGLADELTDEKEVAACIDENLFAQYKNVPDALKKLSKEGTDKKKQVDPERRRIILQDCAITAEDLRQYPTI